MRTAVSIALLLALLVATIVVAADDAGAAPPPDPDTVVSVPIPSVSRGGMAIQAERYLSRRFSLAGSLGGRSGAEGDYESLTIAAGVEGRWFFLARRNGTGPFGAVRVDFSRITARDTVDDREIGTTRSIAGSALVGWRWLLWRHLEITPSIGMAIRTEATSRSLATDTRGALTIGWTIGWMW
jgi:hypothetical protein